MTGTDLPEPRPPRAPVIETSLRVTNNVRIPFHELMWKFTGSGGPGGQHANTSNTRVELTFDVEASSAFGPRQRERVLTALGPTLRVTASDTRSQSRNRDLALGRLAAKVAAALHVEAPRRATKPSRSAKRARLDDKQLRSTVKKQRQRPAFDD